MNPATPAASSFVPRVGGLGGRMFKSVAPFTLAQAQILHWTELGSTKARPPPCNPPPSPVAPPPPRPRDAGGAMIPSQLRLHHQVHNQTHAQPPKGPLYSPRCWATNRPRAGGRRGVARTHGRGHTQSEAGKGGRMPRGMADRPAPRRPGGMSRGKGAPSRREGGGHSGQNGVVGP